MRIPAGNQREWAFHLKKHAHRRMDYLDDRKFQYLVLIYCSPPLCSLFMDRAAVSNALHSGLVGGHNIKYYL